MYKTKVQRDGFPSVEVKFESGDYLNQVVTTDDLPEELDRFRNHLFIKLKYLMNQKYPIKSLSLEHN
ncbi:hypothetical protein AT705_19435 [Pseudoalteromonas rubra]|uniref:Uncharacterized protein n=1 Tax=Pseudoalteromonas rubra TaxID=43658 RepID=A0A0U2Y420_9GAMM|nr:hypothetical protein AT705_19435 [Pseudoalteromonas rubra]